MSEACNQSQWATWIALRGQDPPTHVATFGNSDPHIVGDWVKILEVDARPHADSVSCAVYDVCALSSLSWMLRIHHIFFIIQSSHSPIRISV